MTLARALVLLMKKSPQSEVRQEMLKLMNIDDEWYKYPDTQNFKRIQELAKQLENFKKGVPKKTSKRKKAEKKDE